MRALLVLRTEIVRAYPAKLHSTDATPDGRVSARPAIGSVTVVLLAVHVCPGMVSWAVSGHLQEDRAESTVGVRPFAQIDERRSEIVSVR